MSANPLSIVIAGPVAVDEGDSGSTGVGTSFVFRPGGTPADGVFVTPAALKAALLTVDPDADKVIAVDTTFGAAHFTAADSPWPIDNATIEGTGTSPIASLTIDNGASLDATVRNFTVRRCTIVDANTVGATATWVPTGSAVVTLEDEGSILSNNTGQFLGAGVFCQFFLSTGSSLGDGTHALCKIEAAGAVNVFAWDGSTVSANAFKKGTVAGGTLALNFDWSSDPLVSRTQDNANLVVTLAVQPSAQWLSRPVALAAGTTFAGGVGLSNNMVADLTGAQPKYQTNPTPNDGDVFLVKSGGTGGTPLAIQVTGGFTIENPGAPGTYSAANATVTFAAGNGGALKYQCDVTGNAWRIVGSA